MSKPNAARNYCFTYNNYPDDLAPFQDRLSSLCTYAIFGCEVGESGTPHLQGYLQLKEKERLTGLAKKLPGCHLEVAKGGYDANKAYCSKDGVTWEFGTPATSGKRTGLADAVDQVKKSRPLSEIAFEMPEVFCRYHRGLEALSTTLSRGRDFKTEIFWFWGPTGTGKSRRVFDTEPGAYWKPAANKWWTGYEGQDAVVIDDYRRDFCTFAELLRLLDRYPMYVETKGGTRSFVSKRLYITSPKAPAETWEGRTEEDLAQLLRRIEHVEYFGPEMPYPCDAQLKQTE